MKFLGKERHEIAKNNILTHDNFYHACRYVSEYHNFWWKLERHCNGSEYSFAYSCIGVSFATQKKEADWTMKNWLVLILLVFAMWLSITEFLRRDIFLSKLFAFIFLLIGFSILIGTVIVVVQKNKVKRWNKHLNDDSHTERKWFTMQTSSKETFQRFSYYSLTVLMSSLLFGALLVFYV